MRIQAVTSEQEFLGLKQAWKSLLGVSGSSNLYSTFEWLSAWWQCFGGAKEMLVLVAYDGERIVAIAPFVVTQREGFRQAALMGGRVTDYKEILIDATADRSKTLEEIFHALLAEKHIDFVQLSGLLDDSPNYIPLTTVLERLKPYKPAHVQSDVSTYVKIEGTIDDYWRSLGRKFRRDCRYQLERLHKLDEHCSFYFPSSSQEIYNYVDLLMCQKIDRWHQTKHESTLIEQESVRSFYLDVTQRLLTAGWMQAPVLLVNGRAASIDLGATFGGKYFACQHSFNEEFSIYSVGKLLNIRIIELAYEQGLREVDFGLGDDPYKLDYKPCVRKMYTITLFQTGLRGQAAEKWFHWMRPQLAHMALDHPRVRSMTTWVKSRMP